MTAPVVFISYSHDAEQHKAWVLKLATDLRTNGVDAVLDVWDLALGQDTVAFMTNGLSRADRVLMVCSGTYVGKAEKGSGGVGFERLILTAELVQNIDTKKFIPVIRNNPGRTIPNFLGPRLYVDFTEDASYKEKLTELLREILGAPANSKPPLGSSPFSATATAGGTVVRSVGPTGGVAGGQRVLDEAWFQTQAAHAIEEIGKHGAKAHMELRFGLHDPIVKSQLDLLAAVRGSEIRTFGWPIGVILDNRGEFRPRPYEDGIRAEIAISEKSLSGQPSYDYWAARSNGDFYLLQSLFEDQRTENAIFFNTRIVRVTEALLFAGNLYRNLGAAPESRVTVRVTHRGLAGRVLSSSTLNRDVSPGVAHEHNSQSEITIVVGRVSEDLVDSVRRLVAPMFMLFDFKEFNASVYEDVVRRFERGEVS